jgi:hypothetical protein
MEDYYELVAKKYLILLMSIKMCLYVHFLELWSMQQDTLFSLVYPFFLKLRPIINDRLHTN